MKVLEKHVVERRPFRAKLQTFMTPVFVALLAAMFILAAILVAAQIFGLLAGKGEILARSSALIKPWLFGLSSTFGIWTLLLAYVAGWKAAD